jgi:hypothetical protein
MYTLTWTPCWLEVKFIILTQIGTYSLLYRHILRKHVAFLSADYRECNQVTIGLWLNNKKCSAFSVEYPQEQDGLWIKLAWNRSLCNALQLFLIFLVYFQLCSNKKSHYGSKAYPCPNILIPLAKWTIYASIEVITHDCVFIFQR